MRHVLTIAGTDPTTGAGAQADLKTIGTLGAYGFSVITAVVSQNTQGVRAIHQIPAFHVREQLDAIDADCRVDAVKIGMLGTPQVARAVSLWLTEHSGDFPVVLDPVLVATSGHRLARNGVLEALRGLLAHADIVTPNIPELAALCAKDPAVTFADACAQGQKLAATYGTSVVVKGGHLTDTCLDDGHVRDALIPRDAPVHVLSSPRLKTKNTHGTGCALATALATYLAQSSDLDTVAAFGAARQWLQRAIRHADDLAIGRGHGPINHFVAPAVPD